jgi:excisionase family DNA binding protein
MDATVKTTQFNSALTLREAAKSVGISPSEIEAAIQQEELKAYRLGSATIVPKEELEKWRATVADKLRPINSSDNLGDLAAKRHTGGLLTTEDAANHLGLGVSTLERHRCQGTGPQFIRLGNGRSIRYRLIDLDSWGKASRSTSDVG